MNKCFLNWQKTILVVLLITGYIKLQAQCTHYTRTVTGCLADHTLEIKDDGTLWASGYNSQYQLGSGNNANSFSPIQIGSATNWAAISAGYLHSLGITTDGKLWGWGYNGHGQLGDGSFVNKTTPTQIGSASNWVAIRTGNEHSLGITTDGKLWGWGFNSQGQVGDGTTIDQGTCTQITTATNWIGIGTGNAHSLAISSDGKLWGWGQNVFGQLGDGTVINRLSPTQAGTATNWVAVSGGGGHSLGITADAKLWAWGFNGLGQLGDGTTTNRLSPTQIGTADWIAVSAGVNHSLGITADGKLWAWGYNNYGQIGDGTTNTRTSPVQIGTATNWVAVSAKDFHSFGITADGQLWAWGWNALGQLGDGTGTARPSPTQIGAAPSFTGLAAANTSKTNYQNSQVFYATNCNNLIARVAQVPDYVNAANGITTAKVWIEAIQPAKYVKRHYEITPVTNASTSTGNVTLYFTQAEFDDFNAANVVHLPIAPGDLSGRGNLLIEKREGVSSDGTGLPSSYSGNFTNINPADNNIIWNSTLNCWEVSFDVTGFSGFFVKTQIPILSVHWLSAACHFNSLKQPVISWKVQEYDAANYKVEKSTNGNSFISIGTISSKGDGKNDYMFTDIQPFNGICYYRVMQIDKNDRHSYSSVLKLSDQQTGLINIYPNPTKEEITISVSRTLLGRKCRIINTEGKILQSPVIGKPVFTLTMNNYPPGMYLLMFEGGITKKVIKE